MSSIELLEDACAALPHATRKMFGGHGLFAPNGGMFAGIVDDDRIILKLADEATRDELCALGTEAWQYHGKMGSTTMREWILVPESFYDDTEQLAAWCRRAHAIAPAKGVKSKKSKTAQSKKPTTAESKKTRTAESKKNKTAQSKKSKTVSKAKGPPAKAAKNTPRTKTAKKSRTARKS